MKTRAHVHSSNIVLVWTLENVDLKKVMSAAASIATLTWHDLEPNMLQDEQFLAPMANLILCLELNFSIFCTFKICSTERSDYSNINKMNIQTQSTKSI